MNRNPRSLVLILGVAVLALASAGCNKLKARDELNKGVAAFKGANTIWPSSISSRPRSSTPSS